MTQASLGDEACVAAAALERSGYVVLEHVLDPGAVANARACVTGLVEEIAPTALYSASVHALPTRSNGVGRCSLPLG